jgi:hypothetical protein
MPEDLPEKERRTYVDPAPEMPRFVIMDLRDETLTFCNGIRQMTELGIDIPTATAEVIDTIQHEKDAAYEVAYTAYEMTPPDEDSLMNQEVHKYLKLREDFAMALYRQFQLFKMYVNGLLFYELHHIDPNVLVLNKLEIPTNRHDRLLRANTRQVDLAHQRRLQAAAPQPEKVFGQPGKVGGILRRGDQVPAGPALVLRGRKLP